MNEIEKAERAVALATQTLNDIKALPKEVGAQIQWNMNKLVWVRVGDDEWEAESETASGKHSSSHVASWSWKLVDPGEDHGYLLAEFKELGRRGIPGSHYTKVMDEVYDVLAHTLGKTNKAQTAARAQQREADIAAVEKLRTKHRSSDFGSSWWQAMVDDAVASIRGEL